MFSPTKKMSFLLTSKSNNLTFLAFFLLLLFYLFYSFSYLSSINKINQTHIHRLLWVSNQEFSILMAFLGHILGTLFSRSFLTLHSAISIFIFLLSKVHGMMEPHPFMGILPFPSKPRNELKSKPKI